MLPYAPILDGCIKQPWNLERVDDENDEKGSVDVSVLPSHSLDAVAEHRSRFLVCRAIAVLFG